MVVLPSFVLMLCAMHYMRHRLFHRIAMSLVLLFDLMFPVWLYMTHDWGKRLIDEGDIISFGVASHLFLVILLLVMYGLQIQAGLALAKGDEAQRDVHRSQARGLLLVRVFVFASGLMLFQPVIH